MLLFVFIFLSCCSVACPEIHCDIITSYQYEPSATVPDNKINPFLKKSSFSFKVTFEHKTKWKTTT